MNDRYVMLSRAGADPENELGGGQFRESAGQKSPSGVQGRSPGRGLGGRSPPEADDFPQLKVARFPYSIVYMHNATEVDSPSDVLLLHKVAFLHLGL